MTDIDTDAIRERERVILPGPWRVGEKTPTGPDLWELPILLDRAGPDGPQTIQVCAVEYQTGGFHYPHADAKADAEFIAHARTDVPALLAKVDELTAERDNLEAYNRSVKGANADLRAELTAANRRADGLEADLRSAVKGNTAWANQTAAKDAVIEAVKAWRESEDVQAVGLAEEGMALVDAYDAYEIDRTEDEPIDPQGTGWTQGDGFRADRMEATR